CPCTEDETEVVRERRIGGDGAMEVTTVGIEVIKGGWTVGVTTTGGIDATGEGCGADLKTVDGWDRTVEANTIGGDKRVAGLEQAKNCGGTAEGITKSGRSSWGSDSGSTM